MLEFYFCLFLFAILEHFCLNFSRTKTYSPLSRSKGVQGSSLQTFYCRSQNAFIIFYLFHWWGNSRYSWAKVKPSTKKIIVIFIVIVLRLSMMMYILAGVNKLLCDYKISCYRCLFSYHVDSCNWISISDILTPDILSSAVQTAFIQKIPEKGSRGKSL